jgi:predicted MFS family arabinose efflux permease
MRVLAACRDRLGLSANGFTPDVRAAVAVDVSATVLFAVFAGLTGPFNGIILRREFGATPTQLALLASTGAAFNLFALLWARALDGRAPLPYAVWPGFMARSLFLLVPLIHSAWQFVGVLAGATLLGTVAEPANAAVLQRLYPRHQRGRALAAVRMAGGAVVIALAACAGKLLALVDYRIIFPVAALFGMTASLRQRHMPVPTEGIEARERVSLPDAWATVRRDRAFRGLLAAHFVFGAGIWLQMPATPVLLVDVLNAGTAHVGLLAAIGGAAGLVGNFCWGRLVDGRPSLRVLRGVYIVGVLSPLVYFVAGSPWVLMVTAVTDALMTCGLDMVWTMCLMDAAGPRRTAQYVAISSTLAGVRGVICPLISAVLIQTLGVRSVYLTAALVMAVAIVMLSAAIRTAAAHRKDAQDRSLVPALG